MSIKNNTTSLQSLLDAVNALPEAGSSGEVPDNVVTCDLEGATENINTAPVNADMLDGKTADAFVKFNDCAFWEIVDETSGAEIRIGRAGNMVTVSLYIAPCEVPEGGKLLVADISGYGGKPLFKVNAPLFLYDHAISTAPDAPAFMFLNAAGVLWVYTVDTAVTYSILRGNLTYITNDPMHLASVEEVSE